MSESFFSATWYRAAQLKPQLHPHVEVHRHRYRGVTWYVLHDHATGRVHRFTPATYLLIGNMNGERTLDELWKAAATQLEENAPSQDEVLRLLSQLHSADLMQSGDAPETSGLLERLEKRRWMRLTRNFKNPLAISVSLIDPDRMLSRLVDLMRPFGARPFALLWLAIVVPAAFLLAIHWQEWSASLPERTLAAENLLLLALMFPVVKFLHELGHGVIVKAYGGAVHDAGLMFLIFMPVPYVDASASLSFRSKYARALVGAAGMLTELALAGIAVHVWLFAETGVVRAAALDVVLIAGLSTIVVNGNPLLRFDGYYILTDLLEIPNLGSRSNRYWATMIEHRLFGVQPPRTSSVLPSERHWLLLYAPLAYIYRFIVFIGIALFVSTEYLAIGGAIAAWSLFTGFIAPLGRIVRHLVTSPTLNDRRGRAIGVSVAACLSMAGLILLVPAPLVTVGEGVVWLPEDAQVRAGTSSFVERLEMASGSQVRGGDKLFQLTEPALAAQIVAQAQRVAEVETRLRSEFVSDRPKAAVTLQELEAERSELQRLTVRVERLVVRSPRAGIFVALKPEDSAGRWVQEGSMLGFIMADEPRTVRVVVRQDDIELVRGHLRTADAKIVDRLATTFAASIIREVPAAGNALPSKALGVNGGGRLANDPRDADGNTAMERVFQFDMRLSPAPVDLYYGTRIYLQFRHDWEALGFQWYRRLRQVFLSHFDA
ncbi:MULTISPECIES: peptidase M50 [unclassified Bradyrhizobium]|uniref:peptidase M50 n=1 Tax=unclassified Bradyrhizobium TaxID=2631580 RepID=UPI001FF959F5|nr:MULTISPECIES: peptidase M50 [unclassified Bradyrhizobium]